MFSGIERPRRQDGVFLARLGWTVTVSVGLGIALAVVAFAPNQLPSGIGVRPIPIEVSVRPSLALQEGVMTMTNTSAKSLHNVVIRARNERLHQEQTWSRETLKPGASVEIGWIEGRKWVPGEQLLVTASGYLPGVWNYE